MRRLLAIAFTGAAGAALFVAGAVELGGHDAPSAAAEPGTTITTNARWTCDRPLSEYGPLPILVVSNFPASNTSGNGAVRLHAACTGDGTDATDLILHVNGDGAENGSSNDGIVLVGAHDIEIEGHVDCGRPSGGAHQDGVQMNAAHRITFRGFTSGDWDAKTATCHGAGGVFYVSELNDNPVNLTDVVCDGCRMVGSTTGNVGRALYLGASTRSGARDSCFAARIPVTQDQHAVDPVNTGNVFVDLDDAVSVDACESAPNPPPPSPPPPPPPPAPYAPACATTCDEQIAQLTAEREQAEAEAARLGNIIDRARTVLEEK